MQFLALSSKVSDFWELIMGCLSSTESGSSSPQERRVEDKDLKICVLGAQGSGKSSLVIRYIIGDFVEEIDPTIEDSYRKQALIDDRPDILNITDTAGDEELQHVMRRSWIRANCAFILCYSITDRKSFGYIDELHQVIMNEKEYSDYSNKAIIICGCKQDLEDERAVDVNDVKNLAEKLRVPFIETSAKVDVNAKEPFEMVVRELRKKDHMVS